MIQEANNNNNCNIFQFNIDGDVDLNEFAKNFENIMLKKTNFLHTKFSEVQNEKLNKIYKNLENVTYISTENIINENDFLYSESIYPSKESYEKVAKEVIKKLANKKNT